MFANLLQGNCIEWMDKMIDQGVETDLILTSPPYDNVRSYNGAGDDWNFDVFKNIADRLSKVMKKHSVLVWVVDNGTINGGETGTSFRQALYFMDQCGLTLHDTMIYHKNSCSFWPSRKSKRYAQTFEYMFIFTKGKIRNDITLLAEHKNKYSGLTSFGQQTQYDREGNMVIPTKPKHVVPEFSLNENVWDIVNACDKDNKKYHHPAIFPEKLAEKHIKSWTLPNNNEIVFDPFMGSATTGKMALSNGCSFIGTEITPEYYEMSKDRIKSYFPDTRLVENQIVKDC